MAVKFLAGEVAANPEAQARFTREARALANLNHPNVATIHGFELLEALGRSLKS